VTGDQLRIEVEVLVWRGNAGRMLGKAYIGDKVACEAVITCRLLDQRAKKPDTAPNPDSRAEQA
jgi:3-hydroxyacyl-[acyl-carrier-protein] dehydratase